MVLLFEMSVLLRRRARTKPCLGSHFNSAIIPCLFAVALSAAPATLHLPDHVRKADDYYLGRQRLESVSREMGLLREDVAENPQNYEAWWRLSKFACYQARHVAGQAKLHFLQEGVEAGKKAVALRPNRVEGHYWLGSNLGVEAEARSFLRALLMVDSIRREMQTVVRLDPEYEQAGGLRNLARLDYRAPFFKGGDKRRSIKLLEGCLKRYPDNSLTMLYLADSYHAMGLKKEAHEQLEQILKLCPDPQYGPELAENQDEALERLATYSAPETAPNLARILTGIQSFLGR